MSNRTDIVIETDNAEGQVLLSASRVYDLTEDKTQDTINSEIRTNLEPLIHKKYIFIGDSYGHASGTNNGWVDKLVVKLGLSSGDYFESAIGGAGFGANTYKFKDMLETLLGTMTADEKSSITDIIVLGGANDGGYDPSEMGALINAFVQVANTNMPQAKIHIGMCSGNYRTDFLGLVTERLLSGYLAGSGYAYINNIQYLLHDRTMITSDRVHPNDTGYERLANFVYAYLIGKTYSVSYRERTDMTFDGGTLTYPVKVMSIVENSVSTLSFGFVIANYTESRSITRNTGINTGLKINSHLFMGGGSKNYADWNPQTCFAILGYHSSHTNKWYSIASSVQIVDGEVLVDNLDMTSEGDVDVALRYVDKLYIPQILMTVPSMCC